MEYVSMNQTTNTRKIPIESKSYTIQILRIKGTLSIGKRTLLIPNQN
jgi:hypothetical protein